MNIEVVKVVLGVLTPLVAAILGLLINQRVKRIEERQWFDRKIIERRLVLYDAMAPGLNDIFCFFLAVGRFRDITPPELVSSKRALDKSYHLGKFLMSKEWGQAYDSMIELCFRTGNAAGVDAKIRAPEDDQRHERGGEWPESWSICFAKEGGAANPKEVKARYEALMALFARDLGVPDRDTGLDPQRPTTESSTSVRPKEDSAPATRPVLPR